MEAFFAHAQRTLLARISPRHRLLPATAALPLRRPPRRRTAGLRCGADCRTAPLSLSSLGLGDGDRARPRKVPRSAAVRKRSPPATAGELKRAALDRGNAVGKSVDVDASIFSHSTLGLEDGERTRPRRAPRPAQAPAAVRKRVHSDTVGDRKRAASDRGNAVGKSIEVDASIFSAGSFSEIDLSPLLAGRLDEAGIKVPTEVQSAAIPTIAVGRDVVIQSYTGSGKTFAYLLPILSEVGPLRRRAAEGEGSKDRSGIDAVIVAPSRELGMQIVREAERLLAPAEKRLVQQLVGGANRSRQEEALRKNKPSVVIGTPGRISEISAAGKLHTHGCRFLVLDEVDQLLSFAFREDMQRILEHVGRRSGAQPGVGAGRAERQLIMVSATVPFSVIRAARSWGTDPVLVKAKSVVPLEEALVHRGPVLSAEPGSTSAPTPVTQAAVDSLPPALEHYYCTAKSQHKVDTLRRCVHALDAKSVIAFMNHSKQLKDVVYKLEARGVRAAALHGDLGKLGRSTTLKNFKNGDVRVLVTNELSARGLDVLECDLVVNLDLPTDSVHYAHRAGRTGRLGRKGTVLTICEESEVFVVKKLRRQLGVAICACELSEGKLTVRGEEEESRKSVEAA